MSLKKSQENHLRGSSFKLESLLGMQNKLDTFIMTERNLNLTDDERIQGLCVAIESEIDEVRKGLNWKWWKNRKDLDLDYLKEEWIDILHFWLSGCNAMGMDADEIVTRYIEKNKENFSRQTGEVDKDNGEYVVGGGK